MTFQFIEDEKGMTEAEARFICKRKELDPDKIVCVYLGHGPHPQWMDFLNYPSIWQTQDKD